MSPSRAVRVAFRFMHKRILLVVSLLSLPALAGDHAVRGYVKRDGTYVAPHRQTDPNRTRDDNYSTHGNENPYTGERGTKDTDAEHEAKQSEDANAYDHN